MGNLYLLFEKRVETWNSGNVCYRSFQTRLSSRVVSNNFKIKILKEQFYLLFYMDVKRGL
jgi:hypothetical protein